MEYYLNKNNDKTSFLQLFGDEEENFYQLGLKDREEVKNSIKHILQLLSGHSDLFDHLTNKLFPLLLDKMTTRDKNFDKLVENYSFGGDISKKDFIYSLMIPELSSFLSLWLPKVSPLSFACSSFFTLNNENKPIHHRILDFPLKDTYDRNERIIYSKFSNKLGVFDFTTVGLPFSGLTSMNEKGLSLAVHQKFTDKFDIEGESVFYIAHKLIQTCSNTKEALNFLKKSRTFTTWNFNLLDKDGFVLEADLAGRELTYNHYDLNKEKFLYFGNISLKEKSEQKFREPYSLDFYNNYRVKAAKKIKEKIKDKKNEEIIKEISSPVSSRDFILSPLGSASVASVLFAPNEKEIFYIPNESPKVFEGIVNKLSFKNKIEHTSIKLRKRRENSNYKKASLHLAFAQTSFDQHNVHNCYHHLQMAKEIYKDDSSKAICEFYFIVIQYIYEADKKVLIEVHKKLELLYVRLPPHLQDILKVIDTRFSVLLEDGEILKHKFLNPKLEIRNIKERTQYKAFHYMLRKGTFIHIDIFDVIFF